MCSEFRETLAPRVTGSYLGDDQGVRAPTIALRRLTPRGRAAGQVRSGALSPWCQVAVAGFEQAVKAVAQETGGE
jgi:hypothetical protein